MGLALTTSARAAQVYWYQITPRWLTKCFRIFCLAGWFQSCLGLIFPYCTPIWSENVYSNPPIVHWKTLTYIFIFQRFTDCFLPKDYIPQLHLKMMDVISAPIRSCLPAPFHNLLAIFTNGDKVPSSWISMVQPKVSQASLSFCILSLYSCFL